MIATFSSNRVNVIVMASFLFATGCALNPKARSDVQPDDSDLFRSVVESVKQGVSPLQIEIDPRPLRADPDVLEPSPSAYAQVSSGTIETRRSLLRSFDVTPTDDPTYRHCAGVLTPPPLPGQPDAKASCPDRSFYVSAIGLARPGGAYLPGGAIDERDAGLKAGQAVIRVLLTHLSPQGATMTAYDYVFQREPGGWKFVKRVPLYVRD